MSPRVSQNAERAARQKRAVGCHKAVRTEFGTNKPATIHDVLLLRRVVACNTADLESDLGTAMQDSSVHCIRKTGSGKWGSGLAFQQFEQLRQFPHGWRMFGGGYHPIHISKSAIAALTLPPAPAAIIRVVVMGAAHRLARNAANTSFSGGWRRTDWNRV